MTLDPKRRLIIFDVDGTLIDSQADILAAMSAAFAVANVDMPQRDVVLGIVGLSLPQAFAALAPNAAPDLRTRMVSAYKEAYAEARITAMQDQIAPLFAGMRDLLNALSEQDAVTLAVATGKSRRGLDALLEGHGLTPFFASTQVADNHPSKPHPSMVMAALDETGHDAAQAVMIGDTSFDMEMAQAAGVRGIGVTWGYHPQGRLAAAHQIVGSSDALGQALTGWMA